jgi:hypothetical protein
MAEQPRRTSAAEAARTFLRLCRGQSHELQTNGKGCPVR